MEKQKGGTNNTKLKLNPTTSQNATIIKTWKTGSAHIQANTKSKSNPKKQEQPNDENGKLITLKRFQN